MPINEYADQGNVELRVCGVASPLNSHVLHGHTCGVIDIFYFERNCSSDCYCVLLTHIMFLHNKRLYINRCSCSSFPDVSHDFGTVTNSSYVS